MTLATQSIIHSLWLVQLALLGLLALVLLGRRSWKSFPFFTAYSLFNLLSGLVEFVLYRNPRLYLYAFVLIESLAVVLGLAVAYEIFAHLFSSQKALLKLARYLLVAAVGVLVILATVIVRVNASYALKDLASAVVITEEAARVLEVGLLAFLFVCSTTFGLHWRQPVFGIALGLALFATVELIVVTVRTHVSIQLIALFSVVRMLAFVLSLLAWIGYLLVPERAPAELEAPERSQLEQWNRAVMELIHQ